MSNDKRSVTTDALDTLGFIISPNEKRDAIHLAVEPVTAGQWLKAGQHVELKDGKAYGTKPGKGVGIVDPFLANFVDEGQMFWLVVYPRQITSLRHVWEHPAFPASGETEHIAPAEPKISKKMQQAITYIENLATELDVTYKSLMSHAESKTEDSWHYWVDGGKFEGCSIPDEFWTYYHVVKGTPYENHGNFLSCSC